MENDILDALNDIGYDGPLINADVLEKALEGGPKSTDYTTLVSQLSNELKDLCNLEDAVNETTGPEDASHFVLELSSFLKELGCPYLSLVTGHMSSRLQSRSDKLLLLEYLLSELMAARILAVDKPEQNNSHMEITIQETPTAKDFNTIFSALKMTQPPANIAPTLLFNKLKEKLKSVIQQKGSDFVGRPIYNQAVSEKQWKELEDLYQKLSEEYLLRREMLITRLDCTVQSFEWKGEKKDVNRHKKIQTVYQPLRQQMKIHPSIKLSDFLAARATLLAMRKTSDAAVRINTRSEVNKVVIGRVPDRGGRPSEQQPPPPEMPSWQQQRSQGGGFQGGRGGGQGGRGGPQGARGGGRGGFGGGNRVQGGWNQPMDQRTDQQGGRSQGYQDNKGGYQDNRGGGGYQGNNQRGDYQGNNRSGYQNDNRGGGYQDNRNNRNGSQDNQSGGYAGSKTYIVQNDPNNYQGGYQSNQGGYQSNQGGYQSNQGGYQSNQGGYQSNRGGSGGGSYRNEHDDRVNSGYERRGSGRGHSNYNRGGRR